MEKVISFNTNGFRLDSNSPPSIAPGETYEIEVELFRTGCFNHPKYGIVFFDKKYLNTLVKNYNSHCYKTPVSFDADHDPTKMGALAWLKQSEDALTVKRRKYTDAAGQECVCHVLCGKMVLNSRGYSLVKDNIYRFFSIEVRPNYVSQEMVLMTENVNGEEKQVYKQVESSGPTIIGGAFTNRPFILDLQPMSLSENMIDKENDGDINETDISFSMEELQDTYNSLVFNVFSFEKEETKTEFSMPKDKGYAKEEEKDPKDDSMKDDMEYEEPDEDMEEDSEAEDDSKKPEDKKTGKKPPFMKASEDPKDKDPKEDMKKEKDKMKMSELMAKLAGKTAAEQVSILEGASMAFSDVDSDDTDSILFNELLETKRYAVRADKEKQDALHLKRQAEKARKEAEDRAAEAAKLAEQAKQIGYEQKVTIFCDQLRKDNHHESAIKAIETMLCSILPSSRDMKFSMSTDGSEAQELDVFTIVKQVMDALPKDARFDFSEQTEEKKVDPVNPVNSTEEKKSDVPDHVANFYQKYSDYLEDTYDVKSAADLMKFSQIVSRIDPETSDYKV